MTNFTPSWAGTAVLGAIVLYGLRILTSGPPPAAIGSAEGAFAKSLLADRPLLTRISLPYSPSKKYTFLVCTTLCACDESNFEAISKITSRDWDIKVVIPATRSALSQKPGFAKYESMIVFDPSYNFISQLNAAFLPRYFVIDESSRLVWKSQVLSADWRGMALEALNIIGGK